MGEHVIAVMEGDGIGPEVVGETVRVMQAAADATGAVLRFLRLPVGLSAYEQLGDTLPDGTVADLESADGWLLGPLTTHLYQGERQRNVSAFLRTRYELFANVRPARSYPRIGRTGPPVDLVVVRENTEGFYADRNMYDGDTGEFMPSEDTVLAMRVITRSACERVARVGFELARRRKAAGSPGRVTLVHKANVLRKSDGLFLSVCRAVAAGYPDIEVDDHHIDAAAMYLVVRPERFDVIVTTNMFGDILSDEAAGLVGGLGLAPGLNAGIDRAMAQATHGSAPDIAGRGIANPVAEILSGAMLLEWLSASRQEPALREAALRIRHAVDAVLTDGTVLTPDLGGTATTAELGARLEAAASG